MKLLLIWKGMRYYKKKYLFNFILNLSKHLTQLLNYIKRVDYYVYILSNLKYLILLILLNIIQVFEF